MIGGVVAIFAAVFVDVWRSYDKAVAALGGPAPVSRADAMTDEMTKYLLKDYGKNIALYALFFALGSYGTIRRLIASRRQA